jgi:hypothetical protein
MRHAHPIREFGDAMKRGSVVATQGYDGAMYIGVGALVLILIIVLIVVLLRR